jgi:hypothetical protein
VHVVPVGTCGHGRNDRRGSNFGPMMTGGDGATACPGAHARNVLARWGGPQACLSVRLVRSCGLGPANFFQIFTVPPIIQTLKIQNQTFLMSKYFQTCHGGR